MSVTLLGFLGRGPYSSDGKRRGYLGARYQFDDWTSDKVTFFLHAALEWLRWRREPAEEVVVLGTAGSMWDEVLLALGKETPGGQDAATEGFLLELSDRVDRQAVGSDDAPIIEGLLSQTLGATAHVELIAAGAALPEQVQILGALQRHVRQGDHVYLDVTHGYRHQPMLALGAAVLLSQLRRAQVKDILYGAIDMRQGSCPAPVVFLTWLLDLLAWTDSVREFRASGRLRALGRVVRDGHLQKALADTAFLLATNQVHSAGQAAKNCLDALRTAPSDPLLDLTRPAIEDVLTEIAGCQRDAAGILAVARSAFRERNYVGTAILLCEAVRKHQRHGGAAVDAALIREVKVLRNSLAHAMRSGDFARGVLRSRKKLDETLENQLAALESLVE